MVLRDSNEGVIFSAYRSLLNCNEALEAEISAIMEGMSLALEWSNEAVTIQTDCAVALAALKEPMKNRS
jgi:ribonuclease HI